jgi:hypothetical protein
MPFSVKMRAKFPLLDTFVWYLNERWSIHQKRLKGLPPPWTDDPALQKYRFCQVRREDDRVTRWIHENWLRPHADDPDLWHAMLVARLHNRIDTLQELPWPEPWSRRSAQVWSAVTKRAERKDRVYTSAYLLNCGTHYRTLTDIHAEILDDTWVNRVVLRPKTGDTLHELHSRLIRHFGVGSFMAGQVIADAKYGVMLRGAADWSTFAAPGPGSLRGLSRVCGLLVKHKWCAPEWHEVMLDVRKAVLSSLPKSLRTLDAQNVEHGLCELDKWCRVQEGGRPKQTYRVAQPDYFEDGV